MMALERSLQAAETWDVRPIISALLTDLRSGLKEAHSAVVASEDFIKAREWPTGQGTLPGEQFLKILRTVPGVGVTTALTWLAEVTDPRRFQSSKQKAEMRNYCGAAKPVKPQRRDGRRED